MLRIRLSRVGKKRQPSYRIVVADVDAKRDGRIVERIGYYNPLVDPIDYKVEEARALHWLSVGAQPSDAVNRLLKKQGTLDRLGRLHAGESLDALVAEFEGRTVEAEKPAAAAEVAPAETEATAATDEAAVEEVVAEEVVAEAVDAVEEAVETPEEAVAEVVESVEEVVAAEEEE